MRTTVLLKLAIQSILKNKMRTLLTMLGIIIGVGAVIVMVAIGWGAKSQIEERIQSLGTNMVVITAGASNSAGVSRGAGSLNRLTIDDVEAIEKQSYLVSAVSPVVVAPTQAIGGAGNWRTAIFGVSTTYQLIRDWPTESGTFFDQSDLRAMRKVVVIGKTVADNLFPNVDPVGERLQLGGVPFTIIGVLSEKGQTAEGSDQDDVLLAPYTTVQTRLSGRQFIPQIIASTGSPEDIAAAQEELALILRDSHDLAARDEDDFTIRNQSDLAEAAQGTTEVMTLLLAAIASISLVVGGIGIMNIMLVSVTERTREIGTRMAVGARGSDILVQFLVESVVMSVLGGIVGLAVGYAGALALERMTGWTTVIAPETILLAIGFSASVGTFFGFYPARKAAALNPIDALRYE